MNERYSRQQLFAPIGEEGQTNIRRKHVVIVGAGALGAGNAEALVRAGIGKLTIIDRDYVEWSNLQRQQLYSEADAIARLPKAIAAKRRLEQINSEVEIEAIVGDAGPEELEAIAAEQRPDVWIDATDNFDTRLVLNDVAYKYRIPWIYGACVGSYGLSCAFIPGRTPCLYCLLETVPQGGLTCDTAGIIGPAVQMVVSYQVAEALKMLVEDWAALRGKLVSFDLWTNEYAAVRIDAVKKEDCPTCGRHPSYPFLSYDQRTKAAVLCGRDSVQIRPPIRREYEIDELAEVFRRQGLQTEANPYLVAVSLGGGKRLVVFADGRALVHGTKDVHEAKTIYYRYLG
ncbi:thiazole biosynthesis adenylyltransferase ThiF [Geobacillus sp. C56-T2]|uniref:thiazole biosynthesis adenylyltransferase ThiF n=1 Tax=Geobacillus sp. C56-T2 TaxID=600773 RepID=UPI0011A4C942|nr:thiazole biosynthesis adenylyltransferase ThiF [Geobacillus sp. C56-T2]NNV06766.1 thiazole biosynthesis adenylyltransferase ThiF [Geobacillus sp. MMMUD3]TWG29560.1 molybdopterin/thiamine biosynthesis adenylyltransferase [Geobacillus sp. C56-T2]